MEWEPIYGNEEYDMAEGQGDPLNIFTTLFEHTENVERQTYATEPHSVILSMEPFPPGEVSDFKHLIYNLLVDSHNNRGSPNNLVYPVSVNVGGVVRHGFCFNEHLQPQKRLAELYASFFKKTSLQEQDQSSVFVQDLYKFYLKRAYQLLSKYFYKFDKFTYLYEGECLFIPNETLEQAAERLRKLETKARRKQKRQLEDD